MPPLYKPSEQPATQIAAYSPPTMHVEPYHQVPTPENAPDWPGFINALLDNAAIYNKTAIQQARNSLTMMAGTQHPSAAL
jgi:hypothetical protein